VEARGLSPGHPMIRSNSSNVGDLANWTMHAAQLRLTRWELGEGVEVVPTIRSPSVMAQLDAVESGAAVGVLPTFLARGRRP
jgi:DNA-binding transcriptional LysR family regulator